jgi:hypothetical protein
MSQSWLHQFYVNLKLPSSFYHLFFSSFNLTYINFGKGIFISPSKSGINWRYYNKYMFVCIYYPQSLMMFLSPTLDTKSAQVTTAMFAACFVHLLWPAETSPGSKVGENLLDPQSVLHISKGSNGVNIEIPELTTITWVYHRLKILLNLWISMDKSIINLYIIMGLEDSRPWTKLTDLGPCQALQRHLLKSLGLWSSAVPFLHGLDAGHRRVPRTRLWWSQEWGDDWWPWILYPGGYPGVSRYVEMYLSKWEIHLSFRFIEFIYIIYIIYYSYYLVLNIF